MDLNYNALHVDKLDVDDVIPVDRRPIIKYCKINCYGDNFLYSRVQAALEFFPGGRTMETVITYDPLLCTIECENVYEWLIDDIREKLRPGIDIRRKDETG